MSNTYTQIHIQAVFAVKNRISLINHSWEESLYMYITGIIQNHGHKLIAINGMPDHIHIFFGLRPLQSLSDLIRNVKGDSSYWINQQKFVSGKFSWQEGFGAFSYSKSHISNVANYIKNQKIHHQRKDFISEYIKILEDYEVKFDERYIFKPI